MLPAADENDRALRDKAGTGEGYLYRYRDLVGDRAEWVRQIVVESTLYFASPASFNDPFDCKSRFRRDLSVREFRSKSNELLATRGIPRLLTPEGDAPFNANFSVSPTALEEILTKEVLSGERIMILKIKKPDFLGESQWEFRHGQRSFPAKLRDLDWLRRFQTRQITVQPGNALRCLVTVEVMYGHDGEAIAERYYIDKVLDVVDPADQGTLTLDDES